MSKFLTWKENLFVGAVCLVVTLGWIQVVGVRQAFGLRLMALEIAVPVELAILLIVRKVPTRMAARWVYYGIEAVGVAIVIWAGWNEDIKLLAVGMLVASLGLPCLILYGAWWARSRPVVGSVSHTDTDRDGWQDTNQ